MNYFRLIVLILFSNMILKQTNNSYKCLLNVIYSKITSGNNSFNKFYEKYNNIDLKEDNDIVYNFKDFRTINELILNFDSLNDDTKNALISCNINLTSTINRCKASTDSRQCEVLSKTKVGEKCNDDEINHTDYFCYKKCPKYMVEKNNFCEKKDSYFKKLYETKAKCLENNKFCYKFQNIGYLPNCKLGYSNNIFNLCLPECPLEMLDLGKLCEKTQFRRISSPVHFMVEDIITPE